LREGELIFQKKILMKFKRFSQKNPDTCKPGTQGDTDMDICKQIAAALTGSNPSQPGARQ
jgi:hypothetical protein